MEKPVDEDEVPSNALERLQKAQVERAQPHMGGCHAGAVKEPVTKNKALSDALERPQR